jgi:hypothetical protein
MLYLKERGFVSCRVIVSQKEDLRVVIFWKIHFNFDSYLDGSPSAWAEPGICATTYFDVIT